MSLKLVNLHVFSLIICLIILLLHCSYQFSYYFVASILSHATSWGQTLFQMTTLDSLDLGLDPIPNWTQVQLDLVPNWPKKIKFASKMQTWFQLGPGSVWKRVWT